MDATLEQLTQGLTHLASIEASMLAMSASYVFQPGQDTFFPAFEARTHVEEELSLCLGPVLMVPSGPLQCIPSARRRPRAQQSQQVTPCRDASPPRRPCLAQDFGVPQCKALGATSLSLLRVVTPDRRQASWPAAAASACGCCSPFVSRRRSCGAACSRSRGFSCAERHW